jgi:hypothetical protein
VPSQCEAMTGLVAIFGHGEQAAVSSADIEAFAATYRSLRGGDVRYAPAVGRMRAAVVAVEGSPAMGLETGDSSWAAFTGVVYDRSSLLGAPLEDLDGHFGLIRFDGAADEAVVATDPLGIQSIFVAEHGGRTYVSTSALAIAKHLRARADPLGVVTFLRAGFLFGQATHWKGIRRLDPGSAVTLHAAGSTDRIYWRPEVDADVTGMTLDRAVDHALEVCLGTFERYLAGRGCTWADISGGYDSRLLGLALDRAGVRFTACTRGDPDDGEVEVAQRIAELKGWSWSLFSRPADWEREIAPLFGPALTWGEAHQPIVQVAQRFWKHAKTGPSCPSLVGGGAGELLRNFAWQQEFLRAGRTSRVNLDNWIDMRLVHPLPTSVFRSDPTPEVRDDIARRLVSWAEPYRGELNTTKLDVMYAYKSTGTFGAHGSAERRFQIRHWPYLYRPVVNAAISTSPRHRAGHRLMRHMMARLDHRVAAIETRPWGGPAAPMRLRNAYRFVPYYRDVAGRAAAKLMQKTVGRSPARAPRPDERLVRVYRALMGHADDAVDGGLRHATMRSAPLYRGPEVDELLSGVRQGRLTAPDLIDRIVTVELALRAADSELAS